MSMAITSGVLSYQDSPKQPENAVWEQIPDMLRQLPFEYEKLIVHPEQQEILIKFAHSMRFNPANIRGLLKKLQQQTQRSFVALVNMTSQ
ncbi:MAG: hypothetical protein ACFFBD_19700 [Candidatus Hodarchaeota archaeon]